ncbi:hypothetical protein ZIOFF_072789 [Zingiber officinale]|uniref:Uncharacterized protein n=1 Tax=Zingiber officinale TaxID=94328 RepID=A0A8J5C301_ZINOF|nr:hypothetical protein ZIOFF_072789 [Zingiber officinale]
MGWLAARAVVVGGEGQLPLGTRARAFRWQQAPLRNSDGVDCSNGRARVKEQEKGEIFKDNAVFIVEGVGVERSGSERRLAIDETNLFETLGGIQPFIGLSTNFYNRWLVGFSLMKKSGVPIYLFKFEEGGRDLEPDLFIELLGELWLGSTRMVGHPALIGRHAPFPVTHQAAERWPTSYFLVGGNEMTRQRQQVLNVSMQQMDHQHLPEIQLACQLTHCVYVKDAGKDVAAGFQIGDPVPMEYICTIKKSE